MSLEKCQDFDLGGQTITVNCSWLNGDGKRWECLVEFICPTGNIWPAQFTTEQLTLTNTNEAINFINSEVAMLDNQSLSIKGATKEQKYKIINWTNEAVQQLRPSHSAHEDYYGI